MLLVIQIIWSFVLFFLLGLFAGMNVLGAILFVLIIQAFCLVFGLIIGMLLGNIDYFSYISTGCLWVFVIIMAVNFFIVPNSDERYKPTTVVAGSFDGQPPFQEGILKNIPVGRPYYIRVETDVQVNGWLRRLTVKNTVPIMVEFLDPEIAEITIDSDSAGEIIEPEIMGEKVIFRFNIIARAKPLKRQITFKVTPKKEGEQKVLITYIKRVSKGTAKYLKTLEYVN